MIGVVEVIVGGFTSGGSSNNARKRHLQEVLMVKNKKVKPERIGVGQVISFSDDDYPEGFN